MKLNNARAIVWLFAMLPLLGLLMSLFGVNSTSFAQIPEPTPTPLPLPPLLPTPNQREGLQPVKHSLPNQHAVTINSTEGWVETPLMLQAGDEFTVSYISGSWSVDYNLLNYVGPEGYSPEIDSQIFPGCKIVSSLPYARLLGEVGAGSTFSVGSGGTFTANASGYLFLRINDMDSCLVDNDGAVVMEVNLITDTTPPTVNWIAPVGNQEVYYASSGIVNLEVSATDDTGVALVDFWRWDAVNGNWIYLSGDSAPPYQATVDISTLNMEWNQINAYAYDHANNWGTENIWVYRSLPVSANFDAWPQSGNAPLTVSFHIVSTENITDCLWDFGDGTTGTSCEAYHDHIYPNAGSYTVSLTVSGSGASDSMTRQNYITVSGVPDLRQNGEIVVSGDLHEGGTVYLTIPVKNFGSVASPAIHVYTEGYTANSVFWRSENSQPPSVFLVPGQIVEFTVQHELWDGDVGWWDISGGVHIWNDDTSSYYEPLDANGYEQKTIDFRVNAATPNAPTNVQASDGTYTDKVLITWNSSSGATSYQVYRCTSSSTSSCGSAIGSPSSTSYNDTGATPGVIYYYRVTACRSGNCSGFSSYNTGWRALTCYMLTRTHTGTGNNPTASPTSSSGCNSGYYHAGESITMTAHPASGHHLDHWSGTDSSSSNHLTMPANAHTVTAHYTQDAPTLSSISGQVLDGGNNPLSGVTISDGAGHTATTNNNGNYTLSGLATGAYTITPSKGNYAFSPSSRTVSVPPNATGQNFTGTIPPVILLPGIMGSRLVNTPSTLDGCSLESRPDGEIWPGLLNLLTSVYNSRLKTLWLLEGGQRPANNCDIISPSGVFTEFFLGIPGVDQDYYERFIVELQDEGYQVYPFAYDWRLDLEQIAQELDDYITEIDTSPVILIGHSLGGLVARQYTLNPTRAPNVAKVITVGTPYWGAPKAALHMREGTIPVELFNPLLDNGDVRTFLRNTPAVMQILPSSAYFQQVNTYYMHGSDMLNSYEDTTNFFKHNEQQNGALLDLAAARHGAIDDFRGTLSVPYYILTANHAGAVASVREYRCGRGSTCWEPLTYGKGDGTVPWPSARLSGRSGDWSGNAKVCTFAPDTVKKEHGELLADNIVIADVKDILKGNDPSHCASSSTLAALQNEPDGFVEVVVSGNVATSVYDDMGNFARVTEDGLVANTIPLSSYYVGETKSFITLSAGTATYYTLTLQMQSDEPVLLRLTDFQTSAQEDEFEARERALFIDVPSAPNGVATMRLDLTGDFSTLELEIDLDNDGMPDIILPPTSVLDAGELEDLSPPATVITIQGAMDGLGFYTGPVTATITATDTGTGVFKNEFSLDSGKSWQTYTEPVMFIAETVPVFEARSMDRAGNQEYYPWPMQRLRPYSIYLPIIQR